MVGCAEKSARPTIGPGCYSRNASSLECPRARGGISAGLGKRWEHAHDLNHATSPALHFPVSPGDRGDVVGGERGECRAGGEIRFAASAGDRPRAGGRGTGTGSGRRISGARGRTVGRRAAGDELVGSAGRARAAGIFQRLDRRGGRRAIGGGVESVSGGARARPERDARPGDARSVGDDVACAGGVDVEHGRCGAASGFARHLGGQIGTDGAGL